MKKTFVNDIKLLFTLSVTFGFSAFLCIICFAAANNLTSPLIGKVLSITVFGGLCSASCIYAVISCEIITILDNKIVCHKINDHRTITYQDIRGILLCNQIGYGVAGVEQVWKISDAVENTICVLTTKNRTKYIAFICEKSPYCNNLGHGDGSVSCIDP